MTAGSDKAGGTSAILTPSATLTLVWVAVHAPDQDFVSTKNSGKWLIVRSPEFVDQAWEKIVRLVAAGDLICAKASTRVGIEYLGYRSHAICVYTRDWLNTADVMAVREVLRTAGFEERLGYKRDIDTVLGIEQFVYEA